MAGNPCLPSVVPINENVMKLDCHVHVRSVLCTDTAFLHHYLVGRSWRPVS